MKKPHLFLGLAIDGGAKHGFYLSLDQLRNNPPCKITRQEIWGDSLIPRARNRLTAAFLKTDCTHLLFIDSDQVFHPAQVARLLSHNVQVVAGFIPKKQEKLQWVCNNYEGAKTESNGLRRMRHMGSGFMLVRRDVFEQMRKLFPDIEYKPDESEDIAEWDFWSVGVKTMENGTRSYLSEDWYFCERCRELGIPVYGDTHVAIKHLGEVAFPLTSEQYKYVIQDSRTPIPLTPEMTSNSYLGPIERLPHRDASGPQSEHTDAWRFGP